MQDGQNWLLLPACKMVRTGCYCLHTRWSGLVVIACIQDGQDWLLLSAYKMVRTGCYCLHTRWSGLIVKSSSFFHRAHSI